MLIWESSAVFMANAGDPPCVFPLTNLQIGDLQSYLSDLSLFLAPESKKFYVLVDNRPWLREFGLRPARLWQLMVTKSRHSPFANRKARRDRNSERLAYQRPKITKPKKFVRWLPLINAATLSRKKLLLPLLLPITPVKNLRKSFVLNNELHRTLYGFIVFEVSWSNVRGINYLNELQTDTSLYIEAKYMQRWEFDCITQAARSVSSWFTGSPLDGQLLKNYLESVTGEIFYDAEDIFPDVEDNYVNSIPIMEDGTISYKNLYINDDSTTTEDTTNTYSKEDTTDTLQTPPPTGPNKRRKVTKFIGSKNEDDTFLEERNNRICDFPRVSEIYDANCQDVVEATQYKDVLILFRFDDRDLPFMLKQIIMSDLRLLTLLEAGLPSWVIFLQSYPVFCHVYRPWMCPFARALYVLVSVVTVLIGFYDLYKNIPLLKVAASRLCGPLFDWIETWEMVSRIKYLGTMLFLHNSEKALKWFLTLSRTTRSFLSIIAQPLASPVTDLLGFLLPVCTTFVEVVGKFFTVIWDVVEFCCSLVVDLIELLLLPMWFIFSTLWSCVTMIVIPIFMIISEILYVPIRAVILLARFVPHICTCIYDLFGGIRHFFSSISQVASLSEVTVVTSEVSVWRTLWDDLFSQVFRALRSILNGFVAFFMACNRHRLSIYNHVHDCFERLSGRIRGSKQEKSSCRCICIPQNLATIYGKSLENRKVHKD